MSYRDEDAGVKLLYWVILFLQLVPQLMFSSYVLQRLWGWYVTSLGVPALGLVQAIGLRVLLAFVAAMSTSRKLGEEDEKTMAMKYAELFVLWFIPALALFEGWILSHWLG